MSVPDIRPQDYIRVYAGTGVRRGDGELRRNLVLEVIAIGDPPGRDEWRYVSGRICRDDLRPASRLQHTAVAISGPERSILNLAGQWQLLRRSGNEEGFRRA